MESDGLDRSDLNLYNTMSHVKMCTKHTRQTTAQSWAKSINGSVSLVYLYTVCICLDTFIAFIFAFASPGWKTG